ncbi:MAG: hypothetical protein FJW30_09825 [Acidobacteria bacterium]|nr:hypothetical protein [Acidobacteriota bacterium]
MGTKSPFQSPFLDEMEMEAASAPQEYFALESSSPFTSEAVFRDEAQSVAINPAAQAAAEMLFEFSDPEFREATRRFSQEVFELYARQGVDEEMTGELEAGAEEAVVRDMASGIRGYEAAMEMVEREIGSRDANELEVEEVARVFQKASAHIAPDQFEYFLGKLLKKAGKIVKGVVKTAKKVAGKVIKAAGKIVPIGPILAKLKGLIKPLIRRVLKAALGKVPEPLQAPARKLAGIFLGGMAAPANGSAAEGDVKQEDPAAEVESELDEYFTAEFFAAGQDMESELSHRRTPPFSHGRFHSRLRRLRQAHRNFARIAQNRQSEPTDSEPNAVAKDLEENLLPAIIAAAPVAQAVAKTAIGIIGRPRVVKFLAGLVAKLIQRFIGPDAAQPLSNFIVDRGLGLLGLEVTEEHRAMAPGYALAQVAEDTVRNLAEMVERNGLTESELEDQNLLEFFALEAFEQAAAANLPSQYLRPELRETSASSGTWIQLPAAGTAYYKKYSEVREISIDPATANSISSFGGETLGQFLATRKGAVPGKPLKARIHLYEAIPGTWLSRISLYETGVPGLNSALEAAWSQIHPLTTTAAGILLGSSGLGKDVDGKYTQSRHVITPSQRFYYLEIAGVADAPVERQSQFNLVLNEVTESFALHLYLSETDAQTLAARMRTGGVMKILLPAFLRIVGAAENTLADGLASHIVLIRKNENFVPPVWLTPLVMAVLRRYLKRVIRKWIIKALLRLVGAAYDQFRQAFIAAADSGESGVTVTFRATVPNIISPIIDLIEGKRKDLDDLKEDPILAITVRPGFHRD